MAELPPFAELLASCRHSAVHLETRDTYVEASEQARVAAWRAGHRDDPQDRDSWWRPFHTAIAAAVDRGVRVRRVRVVSEPVTDYIRFQHDITFQNLAAGEDVRWLPRRDARDLLLPALDFWLFDQRLIRWHHFAGDGHWLEDVLDQAPGNIDRCGEAFEAIWTRAIPHRDYRPENPGSN